MREKFDPLTGRFADGALEGEFQRYSFARNLNNNMLGMAFGAVIFGLYIVLDYFSLESPGLAIVSRIVAFVLLLLCSFLVRFPTFAKHHERLTILSVTSAGMAINIIIWNEPNLENTYYVGLIQVGVLLCFLYRIQFTSALVPLILIWASFVIAVQGKPEDKEPIVQVVVLTTMFISCAFGVYLLERFRRNDFINARVIENQNAKLNELLDDLRVNYDRKIAALNMLVHYVKTPLHQIRGFSEVLLNILNEPGNSSIATNGIDSAQFIKSASDELTKNVSKLLIYHRLDELDKNDNSETGKILARIRDFDDLLEIPIEYNLGDVDPAFVAGSEPLDAFITALADYYMNDARDLTQLEVSATQDGDELIIQFIDDAEAMNRATFVEMTTPLTEITDYLNSDGSNLGMALRTAARAAGAICGELKYRECKIGNHFELRIAQNTQRSKQTTLAA